MSASPRQRSRGTGAPAGAPGDAPRRRKSCPRPLARRVKRGALDFELPEPEILIDICDQPRGYPARARHFGHQLSRSSCSPPTKRWPAIWKAARGVLFTATMPNPTRTSSMLFSTCSGTRLWAVFFPSRGTPRESRSFSPAPRGRRSTFLVNRLALRTMMQAEYAPENKGHFGLALRLLLPFHLPHPPLTPIW